jgi:hypothetical protein
MQGDGLKRAATAMLAGLLTLALAGCATTSAPNAKNAAPPKQAAKIDPYAAIPADGPHEQAAYAAVPAALAYVQKTTRQQKREVTDVSGGKATLVSYTLQAEVDDRLVLFEVRGDGKAYERYRYPASPDPRMLFWQESSRSEGVRLTKPAGPGETAAAAAVEKVMEAAAPGKTATIFVYGYNFYWIGPDGTPVNTPGGSPFTIAIDPVGDAGSWSS